MRHRTTSAIIRAAALAVCAAGCAGSPAATVTGSASRPAATPAPPAGTRPPDAIAQLCGPPDAPGRLITIPAADGVHLAAVAAGAGRRGVVLIPELGRSGKCGWWNFAAYLAAHGYRVLLFDHRCTGESACPAGAAATDLMADIRAAVTRLRRAGAAKVALIGASQGASEAVIDASLPAPGVTGVVAMSAGELTQPLARHPYPATALLAAHGLHVPALFAVAAADPYVSVQQTRHLVALTAARSKRLIVLSAGAGHGWDLVTPMPLSGALPTAIATVLAFLHRVTS